MENTFTIEEISSILKERWPTADEFKRIPFGKNLMELGESEEHGYHVKSVIHSMSLYTT